MVEPASPNRPCLLFRNLAWASRRRLACQDGATAHQPGTRTAASRAAITIATTARLLLFSRLHVPATRGLALRAMERPQKRQRPPDLMGDEMKRYEAESCDVRVDMSRPCVVRLDGHW